MSSRELWRPSTPERLRSGWKRSPEKDGWRALRKELDSVAAGLSLDGDPSEDALLWGLSEDLRSFAAWRAATLKLLRDHSKATNKARKPKKKTSPDRWTVALTAAVEAWCDIAEQAELTTRFALECLTWAYALPAVAQQVEGEIWWRLAERLDATATQAGSENPGSEPCCLDMLNNQLLAGELALVLSTVLPHARPWRALGKQANDVLTEGVLTWTDGEGLPPGRGIACLGAIAACWTRSRRLSYQTGGRCWDAAAQTQYEWLVRQLVRLIDRDGALLLGPKPLAAKQASGVGLVLAALECAGDESDFAAAALRLGVRATGEPAPSVDPPDPSANSEWSGVSLLSAGWAKKDARLLATYDQTDCRVSLANHGATLISGVWSTTIKVAGEPVAFAGEWEEQCWFSDDDCDYLEIAADLADGGRIERVVLHAKQDASAMLIDIVSTGDQAPAPLAIETRLPLAEGVRFDASGETREGWLANESRQLAGVIPPALAEWRVEPRGGELTEQDAALVLTHEAVGQAIACPVWFDFKPKRFAKQRTWRQLTVAESLEPVPRDTAVGFRVQSGKDQWLLYRSLAPRANRTVMGQNYSSESFFGRFDPATGLAEEYFEVEA